MAEMVWPEGALDAWDASSPDFVTAREAEWEYVERNLRALDFYIKKKHIRKHKELFMTGRVDKTRGKDDEFGPVLDVNTGIMYYQLWYYPDEDPAALTEIFATANSAGTHQGRTFLKDFARELTEYDPDYGLMGAREEKVFRAMYPSYDIEDRKFGANGRRICSLGPRIDTVTDSISNAHNHLFLREHPNRHHHGLFIWDYLDYYLDKQPVEAWDLSRTRKELLFRPIYILRYGGDRFPKFRRDDRYVQQVIGRARERFNGREFGAGLMSVWDDIEELYGPYSEDDNQFK